MPDRIGPEMAATRIAPPTLVRLDRITKSFGVRRVVDDLSLEIRDGEFFCLLGPSGCGKSTLLRLIAGFETPECGTITLDGADLLGVPPHRRPLNMMFQSYALFPHMDVARNVAFGLKRAGLPRREVGARVGEMLRLVRLEDYGTRYPAQLSGGQMQRVALARALARRPRLLLLDEPLGALDRRLREETQMELKTLQARLGTTFVMVTHDQSEAMTLADRIGVMDAGRLVQVDDPRTLYRRPATRFVAGFVGDVNMIPGRIVGRQDGIWRIATDLSPDPLAVAEDGEAPGEGTPIGIAIRPEDLRIVAAGAPNGLPVEVLDVGYVGAATMLRLRHATGLVLRMSDPEERAVPIRPGDPLVVAFAPRSARLLAR